MPNHRRAVDPAHPLGAFALRLRRLQAEAVARAGNSEAARLLSPDKIAATSPWRTSRTAIFAALNGTRLASPDTLCALVTAWDPRGGNAIGEWLKERDDVEQRLITYQRLTLTTPMVGKRPAGELRKAPEAVTEFHRALRQVYEDAGSPTYTRIFKKTNLPPSTVRSWLVGQSVPRHDRLERLMAGLGVADDRSTVMWLQQLQERAATELERRRSNDGKARR
jgi:hypothetical protein